MDVDPDKIRDLLPEMEEYNRRDSSTMGFLTQKEVGHLTEVRNLAITLLLTTYIHNIYVHTYKIHTHTYDTTYIRRKSYEIDAEINSYSTGHKVRTYI